MEYRFVKRWDTNTQIERWNEDRKSLNEIINAYNDWQIHHDFDIVKGGVLLALIEYGIQTLSDESSDYERELESMKLFVENCIAVKKAQND